MSVDIAIYGASGFGREVAWLAQACSNSEKSYRVVCFVDDDTSKHGSIINRIPVMSLEEARQSFPEAQMVGGIGNPQIRAKLMQKAMTAGFSVASLIHPRTEMSEWIEMGEGVVICAGNILTTNITLGDHVQINLDCTVGHDAILGDFTTLSPGVHVSGYVTTGKRVYIGTGAVIINGTAANPLVIGDDAIIGAGACVTKSVASGQTVVGVPAKPLQRG